MRETTALGAAIAAGFAIDVWQTFDDLKNVNLAGQTSFKPELLPEKSAKMFSLWEKAVQMS